MFMFRRSLFIALLGAALGGSTMAYAAPHAAMMLGVNDDVTVHDAWARASAGAATTGAAYVTLMGGSQPDQLIGASTPVAATAEVHETINDNGVMKMRPLPGLAIPAGGTVTFAPGGTHIMMTGLKQKLTAGQSFPLTLKFAHTAPITVNVQVRGLSDHDHMHM
jgi:copper(I)-binding protein